MLVTPDANTQTIANTAPATAGTPTKRQAARRDPPGHATPGGGVRRYTEKTPSGSVAQQPRAAGHQEARKHRQPAEQKAQMQCRNQHGEGDAGGQPKPRTTLVERVQERDE